MKDKGIGLCSLIFIVFLILKLTEAGVVTNWSWWWVTAPLWIPTCIVIGGLILCWFGVKLFLLCTRLYYKCFASKSKREKYQSDMAWLKMKRQPKKQSLFMERLREAQEIQDKQRKQN